MAYTPIVLAEEPLSLQEIKVTAKNDDVGERRESTSQKIIVDRKQIDNMSVMTIGEVLGKLPGVEIISGGSSAQRARGMSRDSVQILIDGERSAGSGSMGAGVIGRLPSGDLERVEILRGSSAEFGGGAPITVNLILKKALPKSSTEVRVGVGSRGSEPYDQLALTQNGGEGNFSWTFPISLIWSDTPVRHLADLQNTTAGTRTLWRQENESGVSNLGHHSISPRFTWKDGNDSLTISPLYFYGPTEKNSETALTDYANPSAGTGLGYNGYRVTSENDLQHLSRLRVEGEKYFGESKFSGRASINSGQRTSEITLNEYDANNVPTPSVQQTTTNDTELNIALRFDKPIAEHLLAVGVEDISMNRNDTQYFTGAFVDSGSYQSQEQQSTLWVQDDWMERPNLTYTYGLRGESVALNSAGVTQQDIRLLPSVAVRWEPEDKWVIRSSLGAGMKAPKLDEISNAAVPSLAENTPVLADKRGNPNLQPETSLNYEAVAERYLDDNAGVFGSNLYVRSTQNFTERSIDLEGVRWVDRPYNVGSALHWGLELDGKIRTDSLGWSGATVKAHLTLPKATVDDSSLGIQRMARDTPKYVFSSGVDANLPKLKSSYGISLQISGRSETDVPGVQTGYTEARTTVDAFWLYKLNPKFNLRLSGQNIFKADTVKQTLYIYGGNTWQLHTVDAGYSTVMATIEGRF
jgi:iron complex outermembrane receptor protein